MIKNKFLCIAICLLSIFFVIFTISCAPKKTDENAKDIFSPSPSSDIQTIEKNNAIYYIDDDPYYNGIKVIRGSGNIMTYNSLSEMESESEYIIKCTVSGSSTNHVHLQDVDINGEIHNLVVGGNTVTPVIVKEVYKGNLEVGQVINISEAYYTYEPIEGYRYMSTLEGYLPMVEGNEYILYLFKHNGEFDDYLKEQYEYTKQNGGLYQIMGTYMGKYVIDENLTAKSDFVYSDEQMQIFESNEQYRKLFREITQKIIGN